MVNSPKILQKNSLDHTIVSTRNQSHAPLPALKRRDNCRLDKFGQGGRRCGQAVCDVILATKGLN
jgi:hypothetical protein